MLLVGWKVRVGKIVTKLFKMHFKARGHIFFTITTDPKRDNDIFIFFFLR